MSNDEHKTWKKEEIRELLGRSDKAVLRGIVVIYSLQTEYEKQSADTVDSNGVGFNGIDAEFMTSLAQQILDRGTLSLRQLKHGRKALLKYAGQLAKVANGKIRVSVPPIPNL